METDRYTNLKDDGKVCYVEPNLLGSAYSETSNQVIPFKPELEDMGIYVDLLVETRGRTFRGVSDNYTIGLHYESNSEGDKISFFQGTKLYYNEKKSEYRNSLTTDYLNAFITDIKREPTTELFGIESINISYNNFYVPEVTINFVDIRGISLFSSEQLKHNVTVNRMNGYYSAKNSIAGSFFNCFFQFPYPKFTLITKGFYGKPVSYELLCSDFKAKFDSKTGNFNATARFIGYAFSFLNDIPFNILLAAPYSNAGKEYWERQTENFNDTSFFVYDYNFQRVPIPKFGDIVQRMKGYKQKLSEILKENEEHLYLEKYNNRSIILNDFIDAHDRYKSGIINKFAELCNESPSVYSYFESDDYILLLTNNRSEEYDNLGSLLGKDLLNNYNNVLDLYDAYRETSSISTDLYTHPDLIPYKVYYSDERQFGPLSINHDGLFPSPLNKNVSEKPSYYTVGDEEGNKFIDSCIQKVRSSSEGNVVLSGFFVDLKGFSRRLNAERNSLSEEIESVKQRAEEFSEEEISKILGFIPTIRNIAKILFAHFDTYMYQLRVLCEQICKPENKANRTLSALGIDKEMHKVDINDGIDFVYPFPGIYEKVERNGITDSTTNQSKFASIGAKYEETWVGKISNKFEEINLVYGLLNGIAETASIVADASEYERNLQELEQTNNGISLNTPVTSMDFCLQGSGNPFGEIDLDDETDFIGKVVLRAFNVLANGKEIKSDSIPAFAMADAKNFAYFFRDPSNKFLEELSNGSFDFDNMINISLNRDANLANKRKAWDNPNSSLSYPLITATNGDSTSYNIRLFTDSKGMPIRPISNISFNDSIEELRPSELGFTTTVPQDMTNFLAYDDTVNNTDVSDINNNAFIVDFDLKRYEDIYNGITLGNADENAKYVEQIRDNLEGCVYDGKKYKDFYKSHIFRYDFYVSEINPKYKEGEDSTQKKYIRSDKSFDFEDLTQIGSLSYNSQSNFGFLHEDYYKKTSINEKALFFLEKANIYDEEELIEALEDKKSFAIVPYGLLLYHGGKLCFNKNEKAYKKIRGEVKNKLIDLFLKWANGDFRYLQNEYEIRFKHDGENYLKAVFEKDITSKDVTRLLDEETTDNFKKNYDVLGSGGYISSFNQHLLLCNLNPNTEANKMLVTLFLTPCIIIKNVPAEKNKKISYSVPNNYLGVYLDNFIRNLKNEYNDKFPKEKPLNGGIQTEEDPKVQEDQKIALYHYCKVFYDKWIGGSTDIDRWKLSYYFNPNSTKKGKFHIIDSFYNNIGDEVMINMQKMYDNILSSEYNSDYSLLSWMYDILKDNRFNFFCLQNFMDISDAQNMRKMFTPIPYTQMGEINADPDFVAMYVGEPSKHLDMDDPDYPDDTFMLNGDKMLPIAITSKNPSYDYTIPAFGVTYGTQYQSYFSSIDVSMDNSNVTEYTIRTKFQIAGANSPNNEETNDIAFYGQDMFTIYSNYSYECKVDMLGCAWIQPVMYFCLTNVPMFKGSYQIFKVNHSITPGKMVTNFTGMRMPSINSRIARGWLLKKVNNQNGGSLNRTSSERIGDFGQDTCKPKIYPVEMEDKNLNHSELYRPFSEIDSSITEYDTILDALASTAYGEYSSYDEVMVGLILTVMYNRWINNGKDWKKLFRKGQIAFNTQRAKSAKNNANYQKYKDLAKDIFENTPMILSGKTCTTKRPIRIFSKNMPTERRTESKILNSEILQMAYNYCTTQGYDYPMFSGTTSRDSVENQNKIDIWHGGIYLCHYDDGRYGMVFSSNCDAPDKRYWDKLDESKKSNNSESEKEKSSAKKVENNGYSKLCNDLFSALSRTVDEKIGTRNSITRDGKHDNNPNKMVLSSRNGTALSYCFDVLLNGYEKYVNKLYWIFGATDYPSSVIVYVEKTNTGRKIFYVEDENNTNVSVGIETVKPLFISSLKRHYGTNYALVKKDVVSLANCSLRDIENAFENLAGEECSTNIINQTASNDYGNNNGGQMFIGNWNVADSMKYIIRVSKQPYYRPGQCKAYVMNALSNSNIDVISCKFKETDVTHADWLHYTNRLKENGWNVIGSGTTISSVPKDGYQYGDVMVSSKYDRKSQKGEDTGYHIAMYTTNGWYSDYRQNSGPIPYGNGTKQWWLYRYSGSGMKNKRVKKV